MKPLSVEDGTAMVSIEAVVALLRSEIKPNDLFNFDYSLNGQNNLIISLVEKVIAMNTKGVEDGIADEPRCDCWKREIQVCDICQGVDSQTASLDELLLNVRSATPEELTAQAESYGKNYKPGPIQATPFMPEAYDHSKCPGCQWVNRNHRRDCPVRLRR